ncbi:choice-of-anchor I family protein [Aeromicrobium sp. CF3.5]|uniref:choice-of-anchor I family protein n=1 Tax=Aeromicrobium sp. CF3.5 TaxID=3373078 RepID=UPI003EE6AD79
MLTTRGRFGLTASVLLATTVLAGPAVAVDDPPTTSAEEALLNLDVLGTHRTGQFDESAAEIVAFDPGTDRTFVVNANSGRVDVLDASDPTDPTLEDSISAAGVAAADGSTIPAGAVANSVDVRADGLVVVAVESDVKTDPGWLLVLDGAELSTLGAVRVGALPDMVTVTPDGQRAVVANEGEPSDDYTIDPEGSVAIVDLPETLSAPAQSDVATADFHDYDEGGSKPLPAGVRVFGPTVNEQFPVSANLEPEYVTLDDSGVTAYVSLQEANALAVVDLATATVTDLLPLGVKDHSIDGQGFDPSDRDPEDAPTTSIGTWPVLGLYMPDTIDSYTADGRTYLVTANEGDAREWGDYVEGARVKDLGDDGLAPICADSPAADLTSDAQLGRLNVTTASGLSADGSCYEQLYSFGARSFSIIDTDGNQVFDSGDAFEQITAEAAPEFFNSNHSESNREGRSDDKGPEPEAITIGSVGDRTYAFIGFERVGGIAVFDITTPADSTFVTYLNNRDFSVSVEDAADPAAVLDAAGDLGPESIAFVAAEDSPTEAAMLAVGNEVSGTTTYFSITADFARTSAPVITGEPQVGTELTATVDAWSPEATFTYAWQRDGEPIDGADEATYTPADADAGSSLTVEVTGTAPSHRAVTLASQAVEVPPGEAGTPTPTPPVDSDEDVAEDTDTDIVAEDSAGGLLPDAGAPFTWLAVLAALAAIVGGTVLVRRRT